MSDLVSIGLPTFNRPETLRHALASLLRQSHENIEIIVSDNASPTPETEIVCRELAERDNRLRYVRQVEPIAIHRNFETVLEMAAGPFFMWAADDDLWEPFFVAECISSLKAGGSPQVAAMMEALYVTPGGETPFFREGRGFYGPPMVDARRRVQRLISNVYGNLFYSVFRRDALFLNGKPSIRLIGRSMNELPFLMAVAYHGDFRVLSRIGFKKFAPMAVVSQARWEQIGGALPTRLGVKQHLLALPAIAAYHRQVHREALAALDEAPLSKSAARSLGRHLRSTLTAHALCLAARYKPAMRAQHDP